VERFEYRRVAILKGAQDGSRALWHRASEDRVVGDLIASDQLEQLQPAGRWTSSAST